MACLRACGGGCIERGPVGGSPAGACNTEPVPLGGFGEGEGRIGVVPTGKWLGGTTVGDDVACGVRGFGGITGVCDVGALRIAAGVVVEFGVGPLEAIAGFASRGAIIGVPFWLAALARRSLSVRSSS